MKLVRSILFLLLLQPSLVAMGCFKGCMSCIDEEGPACDQHKSVPIHIVVRPKASSPRADGYHSNAEPKSSVDSRNSLSNGKSLSDSESSSEEPYAVVVLPEALDNLKFLRPGNTLSVKNSCAELRSPQTMSAPSAREQKISAQELEVMKIVAKKVPADEEEDPKQLEDLITMIKKEGFNINAHDEYGKSIVYKAALSNRYKLVDSLLACRADVSKMPTTGFCLYINTAIKLEKQGKLQALQQQNK